MKVFSWVLLALAFINLLVLSFAFRDFSFLLTVQFFFSAVGLPLATYLLVSRKLLHWFVSTDEEGNRVQVFTEEMDKEEGDLEEEFNNIQRGFFSSCK